jgi:hypothetical protein
VVWRTSWQTVSRSASTMDSWSTLRPEWELQRDLNGRQGQDGWLGWGMGYYSIALGIKASKLRTCQICSKRMNFAENRSFNVKVFVVLFGLWKRQAVNELAKDEENMSFCLRVSELNPMKSEARVHV